MDPLSHSESSREKFFFARIIQLVEIWKLFQCLFSFHHFISVFIQFFQFALKMLRWRDEEYHIGSCVFLTPGSIMKIQPKKNEVDNDDKVFFSRFTIYVFCFYSFPSFVYEKNREQ